MGFVQYWALAFDRMHRADTFPTLDGGQRAIEDAGWRFNTIGFTWKY